MQQEIQEMLADHSGFDFTKRIRPRTRWDVNPPKKYVSPYWRALSTALAGRREQTLQLLDEADLAHDPRMIFLQNEPVFDFLHHEPRYQTLVQKLGLPPAY